MIKVNSFGLLFAAAFVMLFNTGFMGGNCDGKQDVSHYYSLDCSDSAVVYKRTCEEGGVQFFIPKIDLNDGAISKTGFKMETVKRNIVISSPAFTIKINPSRPYHIKLINGNDAYEFSISNSVKLEGKRAYTLHISHYDDDMSFITLSVRHTRILFTKDDLLMFSGSNNTFWNNDTKMPLYY
jgi:hypothetical protein